MYIRSGKYQRRQFYSKYKATPPSIAKRIINMGDRKRAESLYLLYKTDQQLHRAVMELVS